MNFDSYFQEKAVPQTVVGYEFTRLSKRQNNILFLLAYLNFEFTSSKDLQTKVAAMRRKGVVFSKMFVLRSMGNELVPSPLVYMYIIILLYSAMRHK